MFSKSHLSIGVAILFVLAAMPVLAQREIPEKRTPNSKLFDLGNGHFHTEIHARSIHYLDDDGNFEDIGDQFEPFSDVNGKYAFARKESSAKLFMGKLPQDGVRIEFNPYTWISLKPVSITLTDNATHERSFENFQNASYSLSEKKLHYKLTSTTGISYYPLYNGLQMQVDVDAVELNNTKFAYEFLIESAPGLTHYLQDGALVFSRNDGAQISLDVPRIFLINRKKLPLQAKLDINESMDGVIARVVLPEGITEKTGGVITLEQSIEVSSSSLSSKPGVRAKHNESEYATKSGVIQRPNNPPTYQGLFTNPVGADNYQTSIGRGYCEFYVGMVPSSSSGTIDDVVLHVIVNGNGDSTRYNVRDYGGTTPLTWYNGTEWSKLGSDTPVFDTISTDGWSFDESPAITSNDLKTKLKDQVNNSLSWFGIGIHNQDESTWSKSFYLNDAVLEFDWSEVRPPVIVSAVPQKDGIKVTWNKVADATSYQIDYGTWGSFTSSVNTGDTDTMTIAVTNHTTLYNFAVRAKFGSILSWQSDLRANVRDNNYGSCRSDYDFSDVVDFPDFLLFVDHFGETPDSAAYNQKYDLSGNLVVDVNDTTVFFSDFNKNCSAVPKRVIPPLVVGKNYEASSIANVTEMENETVIDVMLNNANEVKGYEIALQYDPNLFKYAGLDESVPKGDNSAIQFVKNEMGLLLIISAKKRAEEPFIIENSKIASVRFRRLTSHIDGSTISLYDLSLADNNRVVDKIISGGIATNNESVDNKEQLETSLGQNTPNPFNPSTMIAFTLAEQGVVTLTIYNTLGQEVRRLLSSEQLPAGVHQIVWDGKDALGRSVSSGIYLYKMRAGNFEKVQRMVMLK